MKKVKFRDIIGKQSTLVILVLLVLILSVTTPSFRTVGNMVNILKTDQGMKVPNKVIIYC